MFLFWELTVKSPEERAGAALLIIKKHDLKINH